MTTLQLQTPTRIDWHQSGNEFNNSEKKQVGLKIASENIEWEEIEKGKPIPFSQGYAIKAAMEQLPLDKASHIGWAYHDEGQLIGIRKTFSNAMIEFHALDTGIELIPVMTKVFPVNQESLAA